MDWIMGMQRAINYVEEHLTEELDFDVVAREAAYSSFYFQRLFSLLCGFTLGDYIRNRRLTLAGEELLTSDKRIIDIGIKYGYANPRSFTRAFLKFHGVTPTEARMNGAKLKSFSRISVKVVLTGGDTINYRIVDEPAFDVIERVELHSTVGDENLRTIPKFWDNCQTDGTVEKIRELAADKSRIFGICYGDSAGNDGTFEYSIAAPCAADAYMPSGFRRSTVPARTWAVFECRGPVPEAIRVLWREIFSDFFPTSGYKPTFEMDIEFYFDGDMGSSDYRSEIWIPVVKK